MKQILLMIAFDCGPALVDGGTKAIGTRCAHVAVVDVKEGPVLEGGVGYDGVRRSSGREVLRRRDGIPSLRCTHSGLRFDEKDFGAVDPARPQIHAKPTVTILLFKTQRRASTKLFQIVLRPGLAHVGRVDESGEVGRSGRVVSRKHHAVLNDHVRGFIQRIEQQGVLCLVGEVLRGAAEDAAIVKLTGGNAAVGVGGPVELSVDKIDAARLEAGVGVRGHDGLPFPTVGLGVVNAAHPVALVPVSAIDVPRAGVERILGGIVSDAMYMPAND